MEQKQQYPKEPWLAVVLSFFWAGIGQIYSGRILRGCILILIETILTCLATWPWLIPKCDILLITAGSLLIIAAIRIWNLFDAHKCARKINSTDFEFERKQKKDPWLAFFLSDLIPGLGQLYLKKRLWGIIFLIIAVLMLIMAYKHPLLYVGLWGISAAFICFHAYTSGPIKREKSRRTILIVIVAFLSLNLIKHHKPLLETYTAESFRLPDSRDYSWLSPDLRGGPSMEPILVYHDRFLVIKSKKYMPNRGDVVVFKPPKEGKIPYIKPGDEVFYNLKIPYIMRVAATAGETIEIKGNSLYIDGHKIQWSLIVTPDYYPENFGVEEPYKVPENCFYVLGDNTGNSYDSRFLGAIPLSDLIGKAYMIYWPPFRIGPIR